jgi:hypothetical protein
MAMAAAAAEAHRADVDGDVVIAATENDQPGGREVDRRRIL